MGGGVRETLLVYLLHTLSRIVSKTGGLTWKERRVENEARRNDGGREKGYSYYLRVY